MAHKFDQFRVADSDEDSNPTPPPQKEEVAEAQEVPPTRPPPLEEAEAEAKEEEEAQPSVVETPSPPTPPPAAPAVEAAAAATPVESPHEEVPSAAAEASSEDEVIEPPFADTPPKPKKKKAAATATAKKNVTPKKEEKKAVKKKAEASPPKAAAAPAAAAEKKKKAPSPQKKKEPSPLKKTSPKKEASPERTASGKTKVRTTKKATAAAPSSPTTVRKNNASSPFEKKAVAPTDKVRTVRQDNTPREASPTPKSTTASHTPKGKSPQRPSTSPAGAAATTNGSGKAAGPIYSRALRKSTTPLSAQGTTPVRRSVRAGPARPLPEEDYEHDPGRAMRADDPVFMQIRRQRRASSTCSLGAANERTPFVLVAAGQPIPHLSPALEAALEAHYVDALLRLPLTEIERVVSALCTTQEHKPVMTYFKLLLQQQQTSHRLSGSNSPRHRRLSGPDQAAEHGWCRSTKMEESSTSMARAARPATTGASSRRRIDTSRADESAVRNFKHIFGNEVRAVFLEECAAVCLSRRARFYREQPHMVIERGIVVPEEIINPFYEQAVNKLLYRLFGWTEEEAMQYAPNVVAIVKDELPPHPHTQEPTEAPFTDPEA